jgi:signal transduction histidine kinase/ligand-binding sensor domain-containing protein/DNA-binding response OmpR family regulator
MLKLCALYLFTIIIFPAFTIQAQSVEGVFTTLSKTSATTTITSPLQKEYISERWTTHEGLPVNHINDIYQTPDGYLWLATFSGLIRFDGVRFLEFNSGNSENLLSNRILLIQGGIENTFWLTTERGDLIHANNGVFRWFEELENWNSHFVLSDNLSLTTWIGSKNGLFSFDGEVLIPVRGDLFSELTIINIYHSRQGDLWIVSNSGKAFFFSDGDIHSEPITIEIIQQNSTLIEDQKGRIWLGREELGYIENDRFTEVIIKQDYLNLGNPLEPMIFSFMNDADGHTLVSTQLGLMKIEDDQLTAIDLTTPDEYSTLASVFGNALTTCPDGSTWSFTKNRVYKNGVYEFETHQNVNSIYCDLEQNLWFTSYRTGLLRYRLSLFDNITFSHSDNNFYGIFSDSYNSLWIGKMFGGLNRIANNGKVEQYKTPPGWATTSAFIELSDGSMIVGNQRCFPQNRTNSGGCNSFRYIDALHGEDIRAFHEDSDKNLWVGTISGLIRLKMDESQELFVDEKVNSWPVRFFLETEDGEIWYATNGGGVVRYKHKNKRIYDTSTGLSGDNIRALFQDKDGFIWAGSEDRGLNRIDPVSGKIVVIRKSDGLYEDGLHFMLSDHYNRMWFSSNRGVFWVDFSHLQDFAEGRRNRVFSTSYTERDGMLNREANGGFQNSGLQTADGRIWFATQKGVLVVNPEDIQLTQPLPRVMIEYANSSGTSLFDNNGNIVINPDQRSFTITFNSPVFSAPERVRFQYKLDGFDRDWIDVIDRREAIYTNIPTGDYQFRVKAYMHSELLDSNETTIAVIVPPRFLETVWFQVIVIMLIALSLGGIYQIRVQQLLKREEELASLVAERTEALRSEKKVTEIQTEQLKIISQEKDRLFANISHEFRTPLTLTIGPLKDLQDGRYGPLPPAAYHHIELSLKNAQRLLRLVGQLMDLTRLEAGKFELNTQIGNLCNYLQTVAEPFKVAAEQKQIHFNIYIPGEPLFAEFDPGHFDKITANLLSNAFKFTDPGGSVTIHLSSEKGNAVITVRDTGCGIPEDQLPHLFNRFYQIQKSEMQPGTGIGLSLAKELTELHGGSIEINSTFGKGSTFIVQIPMIELPGSFDSSPNEASQELTFESTLKSQPLSHESNQIVIDEARDFQKTILLVDDHPDIRLYLCKHLEEYYNIIEAASGNEAMKLVISELPDLIISDVMMPDGDGFELLKQIRENRETNYIPIVLLTARSEAEDKLSGLGFGANDYITKPFNVKELKVRVKNIFDQQKRLKHYLLNGNKTEIDIKIHHDQVNSKSIDQIFLASVKSEIQTNLADENFSVEDLAMKLKQSRSNLHRRLTKLTGETPSAMIRRMRLELGAQLLKQKAGTVSEVAYSTGFKSIAHFSRIFREHFKKTPTEFIDSQS